MAVLLLAEVSDGALALDATAKAVTAARQLGEVTALCVGAQAADAAAEAARIDGVAKVLCAEDPIYGHRLAEPAAALIVSLAGDYEHIVAPATTDAKNIMPRVAALLDVMILSDVTGVVDGATFERPIYAGNAIQTVKTSDAKKVITFRTSTFDAAGDGGSAAVDGSLELGFDLPKQGEVLPGAASGGVKGNLAFDGGATFEAALQIDQAGHWGEQLGRLVGFRGDEAPSALSRGDQAVAAQPRQGSGHQQPVAIPGSIGNQFSASHADKQRIVFPVQHHHIG